ncbi:MAG TPA: OadG family transporter subunit [Dehalococcoidia bacterium]|nr:OadG family transporter subunit [Dehalococcoidia bacterium]
MLDAVWITLGGMAIVFATLVILMLVMAGLGKWLKPKEEEKEKG